MKKPTPRRTRHADPSRTRRALRGTRRARQHTAATGPAMAVPMLDRPMYRPALALGMMSVISAQSTARNAPTAIADGDQEHQADRDGRRDHQAAHAHGADGARGPDHPLAPDAIGDPCGRQDGERRRHHDREEREVDRSAAPPRRRGPASASGTRARNGRPSPWPPGSTVATRPATRTSGSAAHPDPRRHRRLGATIARPRSRPLGPRSTRRATRRRSSAR